MYSYKPTQNQAEYAANGVIQPLGTMITPPPTPNTSSLSPGTASWAPFFGHNHNVHLNDSVRLNNFVTRKNFVQQNGLAPPNHFLPPSYFLPPNYFEQRNSFPQQDYFAQYQHFLPQYNIPMPTNFPLPNNFVPHANTVPLNHSVRQTRPSSDQTQTNEVSTSQKTKRIRTVFTNDQHLDLEAEFRLQMYPHRSHRIEIGSRLGLDADRVKVWFQNRRMKLKKELQANATEVTKNNRVLVYKNAATSYPRAATSAYLAPAPAPKVPLTRALQENSPTTYRTQNHFNQFDNKFINQYSLPDCQPPTTQLVPGPVPIPQPHNYVLPSGPPNLFAPQLIVQIPADNLAPVQNVPGRPTQQHYRPSIQQAAMDPATAAELSLLFNNAILAQQNHFQQQQLEQQPQQELPQLEHQLPPRFAEHHSQQYQQQQGDELPTISSEQYLQALDDESQTFSKERWEDFLGFIQNQDQSECEQQNAEENKAPEQEQAMEDKQEDVDLNSAGTQEFNGAPAVSDHVENKLEALEMFGSEQQNQQQEKALEQEQAIEDEQEAVDLNSSLVTWPQDFEGVPDILEDIGNEFEDIEMVDLTEISDENETPPPAADTPSIPVINISFDYSNPNWTSTEPTVSVY